MWRITIQDAFAIMVWRFSARYPSIISLELDHHRVSPQRLSVTDGDECFRRERELALSRFRLANSSVPPLTVSLIFPSLLAEAIQHG